MDSFMMSYINCIQTLPVDLQTFISDYLQSDILCNHLRETALAFSRNINSRGSSCDIDSEIDSLMTNISQLMHIYDIRLNDIQAIEDKFTLHEKELRMTTDLLGPNNYYSSDLAHVFSENERLLELNKYLLSLKPVQDIQVIIQRNQNKQENSLGSKKQYSDSKEEGDMIRHRKKLVESYSFSPSRMVNRNSTSIYARKPLNRNALVAEKALAKARQKSRMSHMITSKMHRTFGKRNVFPRGGSVNRIGSLGRQATSSNDPYGRQHHKWLVKRQAKNRRPYGSSLLSRSGGLSQEAKRTAAQKEDSLNECCDGNSNSDDEESPGKSTKKDTLREEAESAEDAIETSEKDETKNETTDKDSVASDNGDSDSGRTKLRRSGTLRGPRFQAGNYRAVLRGGIRSRGSFESFRRGGARRLSRIANSGKLRGPAYGNIKEGSSRRESDQNDEENIADAEDDDADDDEESDRKLYCHCQRVSFGPMIGCDNKSCKYEWFHFNCVDIKVRPRGKWFCHFCKDSVTSKAKR